MPAAAILLGRLAQATSKTAHRRGLALAVAEVLHGELGVLGMDLVLPSDHGEGGWTSLSWWPGARVTQAPAAEPHELPEGRPKMRLVQGHWEVRVPVPLGADPPGQLSLGFPGGEPPAASLEQPDLLLTVGCVVGMACHGCDLVARVAALSRRAHRENRRLQRRLTELGADRPLVAVSQAMQDVLEQVELVASHPTAVLIRGESGTGKELLARTLHGMSQRREGAFVAVNCAALPEALVESELFGHERGAFTGATGRHVGRFERADGGTLFLDEVGELPASAQAKLLRALQEGVIERVGGRAPIDVDVRIVAATHQPLERMLARGRFREDLFYRLNVFPIHVPPLRDRPQDIPELARSKLADMCERLGRDVPQLSRRQLKELSSRPWPGNVRELQNYLERALILSRGPKLHLPEGSGERPAEAPPRRSADATLDDAIRFAISDALERTGGKLYGADGAAALLGVKPSTLQSKMRKLGIRRAPSRP